MKIIWIASGHDSIVHLLLETGANIDTTIKHGSTSFSILDWAIFHGNLSNFMRNDDLVTDMN